jgi:hypothetical protein
MPRLRGNAGRLFERSISKEVRAATATEAALYMRCLEAARGPGKVSEPSAPVAKLIGIRWTNLLPRMGHPGPSGLALREPRVMFDAAAAGADHCRVGGL